MHLIPLLATAIYAIVGGPSVGKTSIIEELKEKGEVTVREAATDYILDQISHGVSEPWNESTFQLNVLKLHLEREKLALQEAEGVEKSRFFSDRGLLDHYIYSELRNQKETKEFHQIEDILRDFDFNTYYAAVFYVHPYNDTEFVPIQTDARHEDLDEATKITHLTYSVYTQNIPVVIEVPPRLTAKERADFILKKVKELES